MKIVNKNNWNTVGNITLEKNAFDAIKCEKNTLVIAGPGAGKTELLAQKACYLFETNLCRAPQKILAISFKKDSAENLKERGLKRYGEEIKDRFISLTYDAFFKSIVDHFIYSFRSCLEQILRFQFFRIVLRERVLVRFLNLLTFPVASIYNSYSRVLFIYSD